MRAALRAAIADVWSDDQVPDTSEWTPHVSLAYSNAAGPAEPYIAALASCTDTAETVIGSVQLIVLGRDQRVYEWSTLADLQLSFTANHRVRSPRRPGQRALLRQAAVLPAPVGCRAA